MINRIMGNKIQDQEKINKRNRTRGNRRRRNRII